jgi:signal transduction histidine kinase
LNRPEEAVGKSDADYFPPHLARQKLADEARVLANGEAIINLIERSETHGAVYWTTSTKVPIRGANGQITGLAGISRNITEFKQAEEALRQKSARIEAQLNSSIEGIIVVDPQGKKVLQNQRCIDLWKIPAHIAEFEEDAKQFQHILKMVKNPEQFAKKVAHLNNHPEETSRDEIELIDGAILDRYSAPVLGKDGQNYGRIWAFHDITERKQAEQSRQALEIQLRHGQKLESIGQLAAGIAHEINTPTQYIGDNTRFLSDAFTDLNALLALHEKLTAATPETIPTVVAEIQAAAGRVDCAYLRDEIPRAIQQSLEGVDRVAKIVRAMKEFSHPGTEEKTPVDINHAIEVTLAVSHNEWKYVAEVKNDFDPALPTVPCLPGELNQVFLNLIVNAAHAIADVVGPDGNTKGLITIRTRRDVDWVEVRIQDNGSGIPEVARPRMFEPFFTTKGVGKGTGQGLAIAHSVIVKKHSGTIHFETETGKGTTFIIRLPLTAVKPEAKK